PPPYRPQPAPKAPQSGSKVLQPKPAAGRPARGAQPCAPAPPTRTAVQPKAHARGVAPTARPIPSPAPPPLARAARPQFAPQPRPNTIQRMEQVGTGGGEPPDDDWQKIWELEQKKFTPNKDKKKQQTNKGGQKEEEEEPPPSNVAESNQHLGEFDNTQKVGKVQGNNGKWKWTDANIVNFLVKVNNVVVPASNANTAYDNQIVSPSGDDEVTHTRNDGEVAKLVAALRSFVAYLNDPSNQTARQDFTVSIFGAWGACDGCKQRIQAFARIWEGVAKKKMNKNVTATLTITYQYLAKTTIIRQTWGETVYGWWNDGNGEGPFFHTIKTSVVGD
ncbi:MAG TPA: hypothetical protein VM936_14855, partial [Pyrinomonadaceae bacterium]|nr:hypothetical protein [Pyrinomonadaceae bacterium]